MAIQFQSMKKNKKGVFDLLIIVLFLIIIAITVIIMYKVLNEVNTHVQASDDIPTVAKIPLSSYKSSYVHLWDYLFLFILIGLFIATLISSFYIDVHPVFFIVSLLLLIILLVITGILSNTFISVISNAELSAESSEFVIIPFIIEHLVAIMTIIGFIICMVLYGKVKGSGGF